MKSRSLLFAVLLVFVVAVTPLLQQWQSTQPPALQTQLAPWMEPLTGGFESAFAQVDCQSYLLILLVDEVGNGTIRAINTASEAAEAQLANLYIDGSLVPFGGPYAVPAVDAGQTSAGATPQVIGLPEGQHSYELVGSNGCGGQDQYTYLPARLTTLITNTCESYTYSVDFTTNGSAGTRTVWITRDTLNDNLQITSTELFGPFVFDGSEPVDDFYIETRGLPVRAQWTARMFKGVTQVQSDFARTAILLCQTPETTEPASPTTTQNPTETTSPTDTPSPTETEYPTQTPTATDTQVDVPTFTPTNTLVPVNTATETATVAPDETATFTSAPQTGSPTWTAVPPTSTPTATSSPTTGEMTATPVMPTLSATTGQTTQPVLSRFAICADRIDMEYVGYAYYVRDLSGQVLGPRPWGIVEWKPGYGAQVWLGFDPVLSGLSGQIVLEDGTSAGTPILNFTFTPNGSGTDNCVLSPASTPSA